MSITQMFPSQVKTFNQLYQQPATGYYIPNYQRPYSWSKDNIEQLMGDIISGSERLVRTTSYEEEYRFLGTVITVTATNQKARQMMSPVDDDAVPTAVNFIVDGQQRLSTVSILSVALYDHIIWISNEIIRNLNSNESFIKDDVIELRNIYLKDLKNLFVMDLNYGSPQIKPLIIRADQDKWTKSGFAEYGSDLAKFLSEICNHVSEDIDHTKRFSVLRHTLIEKNYHDIQKIMNKAYEVSISSSEDTDDNDESYTLPSAQNILANTNLINDVFGRHRPNLNNYVTSGENLVIRYVQLLTLAYYLMKRCLINHVQPHSEAWAFDMFQSLNSTGEPLTSIDIFKAIMLQRIKLLPESQRSNIRQSIIGMYEQLEEYIGSKKEEKIKKTNEVVIMLGLSYEGRPVQKVTSDQKQWLTDMYDTAVSADKQKQVISRIVNTVSYIKDVRKLQESKAGFLQQLSGNVSNKTRDEAMLAVLFLRDAGHSIVDGALNNAYHQVIVNNNTNVNDAVHNYCQIARIMAAFYALRWPQHKTKKLPNIHRDMMKDLGWQKNTQLDATKISRRLMDNLEIPDRDLWITTSVDNLRYGSGSDKLVKFALHMSMLNTEVQEGRLVALKGDDVASFLSAMKWYAESFSTIEHIAPQTRTDAWSSDIYPEYVNRLGNLVLLPATINSGVGNKSWKHKWIYYSHTAESNSSKLSDLTQIALQHNVSLESSIIEKLQNSTYNKHLQPILALGIDCAWSKDLIQERSFDICALLYDRMMQWLHVEE